MVHFVKVGNPIFAEANSCKCPDFLNKVKKALGKIAERPVGCRLIEKIANKAFPIFIEIGEYNHTDFKLYELSRRGWVNLEREREQTLEQTTIYLKPEDTKVLESRTEEIDHPFFVALAHSLIHAYQNSKAKDGPFHSDHNCNSYYARERELLAVTIRKKKDGSPKISENAIRQEHGLPLRFLYDLSNMSSEEDLQRYALDREKAIAKIGARISGKHA